jgi:hypothetical protein
MSRISVMALAMVLGLVIAVGGAGAQDQQTSKGMAAVESATKAGKYAFIFFYNDDGDQTASMRQIFKGAVAKVSKSAARVEVNVADPSEAAIVSKYGVAGVPMPFVLAIAPNGAITGGFPAPFEERQIVDAFATPGTQASLKAIQEGKTVLLCIQNAGTTLNDAAMKGVRDLKADPKYAASTEIITLDPSDPAEAKLLGMLGVDPKISQALTVCLVPSGQATAKLSGATTKEMIAGSLKSGGGGCCPGGAKSCGPTSGTAPATTKTKTAQGGSTSGTGK